MRSPCRAATSWRDRAASARLDRGDRRGGVQQPVTTQAYPPFVYVPEIPAGLDAALSFAMALLIAFRVNRAYERWWEARTLWGTLVNVSRNLAIKIRQLQRPDLEQRRTIRDLEVAFCVGLKDHLRDDVDHADLPAGKRAHGQKLEKSFVPEKTSACHVPSRVVGELYATLHQWRTAGELSDAELWVLDAELRAFLDVCGGCERIKSTLMPVSWRFVTWQCIGLYLVVLPWGLVDDFATWTIPLSVLAAYFVTASEAIAHYVEEPFGFHEDHLDLQRLCDVIERSVTEILLDD